MYILTECQRGRVCGVFTTIKAASEWIEANTSSNYPISFKKGGLQWYTDTEADDGSALCLYHLSTDDRLGKWIGSHRLTPVAGKLVDTNDSPTIN